MRDLLDVEQGQGPAGRLLEAAIRVAFERAQQAGDIPVGARADAEQGLGRAWQELVRRAVVQCDAFARLQPPDKSAQLIGLGRPYADRKIARDLQVAGPGKLELQACIAWRLCGQNKALVEIATRGELHSAAGRSFELRGAA